MNRMFAASSRKRRVARSRDEFRIDAGLGGEVEVGDGPGGGQAGESHPGAGAAGFDRVDLDAQECLDRRGHAVPGGAGVVEDPGQGLGGVGEFEVVEMAAELPVDLGLTGGWWSGRG